MKTPGHVKILATVHQWPLIWCTAGTRPHRGGGHWFRVAYDSDLTTFAELMDAACVMPGCGRPGREHLTWVGEWMLPKRELWQRRWLRAKSMWSARRRRLA